MRRSIRCGGGAGGRATVLAVVVAFAALAYACGGGKARTPTPTLPPVITPPPVLDVPRGGTACYISQHPAADIPTVRSYRLVAAQPLPEGVTPTVKSVRLAGADATRVLDAELCFAAGANAAPGRIDARLELGLFTADAEKQSANARLQPVKTLPIRQVVIVR